VNLPLGTALAGGRVHDLVAGLRRGAWAYALGAVLLLVGVPAIDDLDALLRTLGVAAVVLGGVITLATAWRPAPAAPRPPRRE
jgi:hypothetical protein